MCPKRHRTIPNTADGYACAGGDGVGRQYTVLRFAEPSRGKHAMQMWEGRTENCAFRVKGRCNNEFRTIAYERQLGKKCS